MPSASPIAVIMLTMKNDSEVTCPRTEEIATVTMIDTMAMLMGMNAATRAPKTRSSTIIAAGSPNLSSPLVRSDSESLLKSWSRVLTAGDVDVEAGRGVRVGDLVQHLLDSGLGVAAEHERHDRRVPVLGDARPVVGVGVPHGLRRAGGLDRGPHVGDEGPELRGVGGELAEWMTTPSSIRSPWEKFSASTCSAFAESGFVVRLASEVNADPIRAPMATMEAAGSAPMPPRPATG